MPRERAALTRDLIVGEALTLLDANGMEGFSMRKLAARLGVEAMSIYHHFPNRQAILVAVTEHVLTGIPVPGQDLSWRSRLAAFAEGTYQALMAHPAVVTILATEVADPTAPEALAVSDVTIAGLAEAGFSPIQQVTVYHAITSIVFGFVLAHTRGLTRPHGAGEAARMGDIEAMRAREAELPHITALLPLFQTTQHGDDFRLTMRLFLDGLEREHGREAGATG